MTYDPRLHHRRSLHLRGYDYAGGGAYFVTMCTHAKKCLFGEIIEGNMILNEVGSIVQRTWDTLPQAVRVAGPGYVPDYAQPFAREFCAAGTGTGTGLGCGHRGARS